MANAHPLLFGRLEGLKQRTKPLSRDTRPFVRNSDDDFILSLGGGNRHFILLTAGLLRAAASLFPHGAR